MIKKVYFHLKNDIEKEKGFIFIDSLIGMVILTVAIMAFAGAYITSSKSNTYAKNYGQALAIAQEYTEDHKGLNNTPFNTDTDFLPRTIGIYTVKPTPNIATTDSIGTFVIPVKITVSWHDQSGDKQISIVSYYYIK